MPVNDELLVKRAQSGETAALEELILSCEKSVYNIAYRFMGNEADAGDTAQDALIKIYRRIGSFRQQSSFSSWVYRLTVNTCLDALRRRKKTPLSLEQSIEKGASFEDTGHITPEAHVLSIERNEDIQTAINSLSDDHKSVIILRDVSGLSYEEISECLSISVGTVKSRISRGRQNLRSLLINC
ncbi:MAG: sigma-70 family RNA polymerase sigma factor [Eubacteriales bacterium]|nr:sigma-70 family RNA polymerase sigma factor [Eubacteriales bacterium]